MFQKFLKNTGSKIRSIARSGKKRSLSFFRREISPSPDVEKEATAKMPGGAEVLGRPEEQQDSDASRSSQVKKRRRPRGKKWDVSQFQVEEEEGKTRFHDLDLPTAIMHGIADLDFKFCTPIQQKALPELLQGKDLIGKANTGTGKSAVFLLSIFTRFLKNQKRGGGQGKTKALILAPTRELVMQIAKDGGALGKYTPFRIVPVYGGVDYAKQMKNLKEKRCDIIAATPGRLLDFLGKGVVSLSECELLVIDEADRMLDMGFIPDVRRIIYKIKERKSRQTMMFSATITDEVQRLASQWCTDPVLVEIEPEQVAVDTVDQKVYLVTTEEKYTILYNLIQRNPEERVMVFVNQKNDARKLYERLQRNAINCTLLSGDVPQKKRMHRLEAFRAGKIRVLVATDVAGRGIHIDGINYVVNYTLPYEPEDYVHRIGRTGRAGAVGVSLSFACEEGSFYLPEIEEFIGRKLECLVPEEDLLVTPPKGVTPLAVEKTKNQYHSRSGKKQRPRGRSSRSGGKGRSAAPKKV